MTADSIRLYWHGQRRYADLAFRSVSWFGGLALLMLHEAGLGSSALLTQAPRDQFMLGLAQCQVLLVATKYIFGKTSEGN